MRDGPIVCIGGSWGGLVALQVLLGRLPAEGLRGPVCCVLHRGLDEGASQLATVIGRRTSITVCEVEDKQPLEAGTAYIAPSGYHMLVEDGHVSLSLEGLVRWSRPSIDVLFESAAEARGADVLAVVLTGANDDGARGAQAVRAAGGRVLVQDPSQAERPEMPNAVIRAGAADAVLPLDAIADELIRRLGGE